MQFFDRPGKSGISLRGASSRPASSKELIAQSNRARERRTQLRRRTAAILQLQSAIRRRAAINHVLASFPASNPASILLSAGAVARQPYSFTRNLDTILVSATSPSLIDAHPTIRRKALIITGAATANSRHVVRLLSSAIQLAKSLHNDPTLTKLLVEWRFFHLIRPTFQHATTDNDEYLPLLRELISLLFASESGLSTALGAQFTSALFTIPGLTVALQLDRMPSLIPCLLAGLATEVDNSPPSVAEPDSLEENDSRVAIILSNMLDMSHDVWKSKNRSSLWSLVSAISKLIGQLPNSGKDLKGKVEDEDGDTKMSEDSSPAPFGRLVQALSAIVSENSVRALFNAAVTEGRQATLSVCNLFNVLVKCDNALKTSFQNALAFWRRQSGEVIGHILPRLWGMCFTPAAVDCSDGFNEAEARLPSSSCTVHDDCGPILLVFARAYAYLVFVQDEDDMFEKRRPFNLDEIREICIVLKNTLYVALYASNRLPAYRAENILRTDPDLFDEVSRLLGRLYILDSRRQFRTDDDFWLAGHGTLSSDRFVQDAVEAGPDALKRSQGHSDYGGVRLISYASRHPGSGAGELLRVAPYLAPFSSRAKIFHRWVADERMKFNGGALFGGMSGHRVAVRRDRIFEDAFRELNALGEQMKSTIRVKFIDEHGLEEAGIDGGGVFKEFMNEVLRLGFSPESYALFKKTTDGLLYPNPDIAAVCPEFETQLRFLGRLLGKAMFDAVLVDIPFANFFLSKMLGHYNYPNDLVSLDPELAKNLKYLKNCPPETVEDLGLNFVIVNNAFGAVTEVELKRDGRNIPVTAANRIEYIHRVSNYRMNKQLKQQTDAFLEGLSDVIKPEYIQLFSERELQHLISGAVGQIDIEDWRLNTKYSSGYSENSPVIQWFWQVLREFTAEEQGRLLTFVTSSPRAPLLGFSYLNPSFTIQRAEGDVRLPTASTCLNLLKLPNYPSLDVVREKLKYALQSNAGFDLS